MFSQLAMADALVLSFFSEAISGKFVNLGIFLLYRLIQNIQLEDGCHGTRQGKMSEHRGQTLTVVTL